MLTKIKFLGSEGRTSMRSPKGFTLIEIMVTVAIIVILMTIGIAVGVQTKRTAAKNSTTATLSALSGMMGDFLKDHPDVAFGETAWVQALSAVNPKQIESLQFVGSGTTKKIVDGWGNPISYVPMNWDPVHRGVSSLIKKPAFFMSYGPDGLPDTSDELFSPGISPQ